MTARALVLQGTGRYADPWHPFERTAAALAELLRGLDDVEATVRGDVDAALAEGLDAVDLLVVAAGDPHREVPAGAAAADAEVLREADLQVTRWLGRGAGLLVVHAGTMALADHPRLERLLPARWLPDRSWHPPFARSVVEVADGSGHPVVAGLDRLEVDDELYTDLDVASDAVVLAAHRLDGGRHPLVLAREVDGVRVVVDALGHDERSTSSADHRQLLAQAARWLLRRA